MTRKAAGIGYHRSVKFDTDTPWLMLDSKSDHVTFGGNQMSSLQNHLANVALFELAMMIFFVQDTCQTKVNMILLRR
jgi:hypothetical protein